MPSTPNDPDGLLSMERDALSLKLLAAAMDGARTLMSFWCGALTSTLKLDGSPVSDADHAADAAVRLSLGAMDMGRALVSEESDSRPDAACETFLLLDPLDGTKDFLERAPEFCVCLAAIHQGEAIAGAIVAPALGRAWYAGDACYAIDIDSSGEKVGSPCPLHVEGRAEHALQGLVSRRNGDSRSIQALQACGVAGLVAASSAVKFGMLAEGRADIHVRHGATMGWDIAAGDAILSAAGGLVRTATGDRMRYDGADGFHNPAFVAVSRPSLLDPVLAALGRAR